MATFYFCDDDDETTATNTLGVSKEHEYGTYPLPVHENEYGTYPLPDY